jgi:hypothetical protein
MGDGVSPCLIFIGIAAFVALTLPLLSLPDFAGFVRLWDTAGTLLFRFRL